MREDLKNCVRFGVLACLLLLAHWQAVQAQDCTLLAPGSDAGFDQLGLCAPVEGRVKYFTFYTITEVPTEKVKVEINWGVTRMRYAVESLGYDENLKMYVYQMPEATYTYAANRNNPKCSYPVIVRPVINGKVCNTPMQTGSVVVWDKDDNGGGSLLLNPKTYYACAGSSFSVDFTDKSTWNCVPPKEKNNLNWPKRTTQFVYGTENTITGKVHIDELAPVNFPFAGDLMEYPDRAQAPDKRSAKVIIPATAQVGEHFAVTLNNWNYCNPRPEAPIQQVAIIKIVARPVGEISIINKEGKEADAFCPIESLSLFGSYTTETGTVLPAEVRYDWEIQNLASGEVQKFDNQQKLVLEKGFDKPGNQRIVLKVTNKTSNALLCESVTEKVVHVIDAPSVKTTINQEETKELALCVPDPLLVNVPVSFQHTLFSKEDYSFAYHLYKRNSTASKPDSTLHIQTGSGIAQAEQKGQYDAIYTQPGRYRIQLVATNNTTGCSTREENALALYTEPIPNFTADGLCLGQATYFSDLSQVSQMPGDTIVSREWDMHYDTQNLTEGTFDADQTGQKAFNWVFENSGPQVVALRITNSAGCVSTKTDTLQIRPSPVSLLSSAYSGELICPGDTLKFLNEALSLNSAANFPEGVSYWLCVSDSLLTREIPMINGKEEIAYSSFYNPGDSVETYSVWLRAKANSADACALDSKPILVKVRTGTAAGYETLPAYSPFEPNCSPRSMQFAVNKATQELNADGYKWSIWLQEKLVKEFVQQSGKPDFGILQYAFENHGKKHLDYVVSLSVEKAGMCVIPATNTYRIYPNPTPRFSAKPVLEACDSAVFELIVEEPAGLSDYNWSFSELPANDAATGIKDDNYFISYKRPAYGEPTKEFIIQLKAESFYGCSGEWTDTVRVEPVLVEKPVLQLKELSGNGCSPLIASFRNLTVGDPATTRYEFYLENKATGASRKLDEKGLSGDLASEFAYTFPEAGEYIAYLKVSAGTCERSLSAPISITVHPDPLVNFSIYPKEACGSFISTISKNMQGVASLSWTIADEESGEVLYARHKIAASEDTLNAYTFENTTATAKTYRVTLSAESATGCVTTKSEQVRVHAKPKAYFQLQGNACAPYELQLRHNTADNAPDIRYTWIWGDGTISEGESPAPHTYSNSSYTNARYYDVRLLAESAAGCVADSTIRIQLAPQIEASFDADRLAGCAPLNVQLTNTSRGAVRELSGWYVREKGASSFQLAGRNLAHYVFDNTGSSLKTYELMFKAENREGCVDSVLKEVKVMPEIMADFTLASGLEVYSGQEVRVRATEKLPGVNYSWNWGDGSGPQESTATEASYRYINTSTITHYYEITLRAQDPRYGCSGSKKLLLAVHPAIQISLSPKKERVCLPELPEIIPEVKNVQNHYWYVGQKGQVDYTHRLTNLYEPMLFQNNTAKPITYEIVYVGTSTAGYKDSSSTEVVVYPELRPGFTLNVQQAQLPQAVFKIENTTANAPAWQTSWDFGNGQTSKQAQPGSYQYSTFGSFTITLTVSNGLCSETYSRVLTVLDAAPVVSFELSETEGCWPVAVQFTNTSEFTDQDKYHWDFGDGIGTSTAANPEYTYNQPGVYQVSLHAYNRTGTEDRSYTAKQTIRVYERPLASFQVQKNNVFAGDEPVYVANFSERGHWYHWDFGDGSVYEGTDQFEPVHYYQEAGAYDITLVVQSIQGCSDTLRMRRAVVVQGGSRVIIPTAFTPDPHMASAGPAGSGGQNDFFRALISGSVTNYQLQIFNRWGELLFASKDQNEGWNGYYKGRLCKVGVYIYKLSAELSNGRRINEVGNVTLVQ